MGSGPAAAATLVPPAWQWRRALSWPQDRSGKDLMDGHASPRIRRLCICLDVHQDLRAPARPRRTPAEPAELLDDVCHGSGMARTAWTRRPAGDGHLAVLPPGVDAGRLISGFLRTLRRRHEPHHRAAERQRAPRIRVAMHVGMTEMRDSGFTGAGLDRAAQMRDAPQLISALDGAPDAPFALAISHLLREDHLGHGSPDFPVEEFTRLDLTLPGSAGATGAWVYLPDAGPPGWPSR
jgi:hypothetical protein